jgi:flavin-dependent dehydrogenase
MKTIPFDEIGSKYDVVIVGAGPSGAATAGYLQEGLSTLVIDRNSFPRDKPCGGVLKEEALEFLRGFDLPENIFMEPKKLNLVYLDWDNNKESKQDRYLLNVSRSKFDEWTTSLVGEHVEFSPNTNLIELKEKKDGMHLKIERNNIVKELVCEYLVGASGASSSIRRIISDKNLMTYIALQQWIKDVDGIKDFLYILDNEITDFYSWVIPKGNLLLIGSAFPADNGGAYKDKFELLLKKTRELLGTSGPNYKKEAALLVVPKKIDDIYYGKENILLVGEEAGLIGPSTAEGISFALKSGYNCARAINKMGDVLKEYADNSKDLTEEMENKLKKSQILFDSEKRMDLWSK